MAAAKAYADAKDAEKEIIVKAYADSKVTEAEQAAIEEAKAYSNLKNEEVKAYADGKVTEAEKKAIDEARRKYDEAVEEAKRLDEALEIGVRNLLVGSSVYDVNSPLVSGTVSTNFSVSTAKNKKCYSVLLKKDEKYLAVKLPSNLEVGEKYTISFQHYRPWSGQYYCLECGAIKSEFIYTGSGYHNWHKIKWTFKYDGDDYVLFQSKDSTEFTLWISELQLETGTKATDWTPAPEDVQAEIDDAKNKVIALDYLKNAIKEGDTEILGGLLLGNILGAKGTSNKVKSYMSGVGDYAFAAGVDGFGTNQEARKFSVTHEGKAYILDAEVVGKIVATVGNIGGFEIKGNYLQNGDFNDGVGGFSLGRWGLYFKNKQDSVFSALGNNVLPAYSGISGLLRLEREYNDFGDTIGAYIKVRNSYTNKQDDSKAIHADGNTYFKGGHCIYDDTFIGTAYDNIIDINIHKTHQFLFTDCASNFTAVRLPSKSQIESNIWGNSKRVTFILHITMAESTKGKEIQVQGVSGGKLLDNNANAWNGGNGKKNMQAGDVLVLRYYDGCYYIVSHRD